MRRETVKRNSEDLGTPLEEWKKKPSLTSSSSGTSETALVPQAYWSSSEEQQSDNQLVDVEVHHTTKLDVEFSRIKTQAATTKPNEYPKLSPCQSKPSTSKVTSGVNHPVDPKPSTSAATDDPQLPASIPKTSPIYDEITEAPSVEEFPKNSLETDENKAALDEAVKCYEEIMILCKFLEGTLSRIPQLANDEMEGNAGQLSDWEVLEYGSYAAQERAFRILSKMEELGQLLYCMDLETLSTYLEDIVPLTKDIINICTKLESKISVYKDNINTLSIFTPKSWKLKRLLEKLLGELRYCLQNLIYYSGKLQGEVIGSPMPGKYRKAKSRVISVLIYAGAVVLAALPAIAIGLYIYFYYFDKYSPTVQIGSQSFAEQNSTDQPNLTDDYKTTVEEHDSWANPTSVEDIYSTILDIIGPTDAYLP